MEKQIFDNSAQSTAALGRAWWQLGMGEAEQGARLLGWRPDPPRGPWTGLEWNDRGLVKIGEREFSREDVTALINEVGSSLNSGSMRLACQA